MNGIRTGYYLLAAGLAALAVAGLALTDAQFLRLINPMNQLAMAPLWVMPVLLWLATVVIAMLRRQCDRPLVKLWRIVSINRKWLLRGIVLMGMVLVLAGTFSRLKGNIPNFVPFYADPYLADLDRTILGTDAWRLTHKLAGPYATFLLDRFYIFWMFVMLGTQAWLNFAKDPVFQIRGLLTFYSLWVGAGLLAATAFSSVGPCFYEAFYGDARYAPLLEKLAQNEHSLAALKSMAWLVEVREDRPLGSGISAMPSLHVATSALLAILLHDRFGSRWPTWVGYTYVGLIWFTSVHLGWHYATDGAVSIVLAIAFWRATGLLFVERAPQPAIGGAMGGPERVEA